MNTRTVLALTILVVLVAVTAQAQIPRTVSYQGILCDATGNPKPDSLYQMTFRIYETEIGGTSVWTEQQDLAVTRGLFSTQLGPFDASIKFDKPCWLSIEVGSEGELSPRIPLSSVGYSFSAVNADTAGYAANIEDGVVSTAKIGDGAVTGEKIASGQLVKSINALKDDVTLEAGANVTITQSEDTLTISAASGVGDNLGDHTATQNINLNGYWLSPDGSSAGVRTAGSTVVTSGALLCGGTGGTPASGAGSRLMWVPAKNAFRAGSVDGTQWDDASIGNHSTATGFNTIASGDGATAMGGATEATGWGSTALGSETKALSDGSTAMGMQTEASGDHSTAAGYSSTASGFTSIAMGLYAAASNDNCIAMGPYAEASGHRAVALGYGARASGDAAIAMGGSTTASGSYSTAMGYFATASGLYSTAMGNHASTNGQRGAFAVGDESTANTVVCVAQNQFSARFAGGYRLFTNSAMSIGATLPANANSWGVLSDSTKKERYMPADGESILNEFRSLRLGSWNYKCQDAATYRHYGPMAQEWFAAFGHDDVGVIGNDTTLASADVDGILCIAVKALEERTAELREKTAELEAVKSKLAALEARLERLEDTSQPPQNLAQR
jgi:hypothetical protein